jgi:hypothetical protein
VANFAQLKSFLQNGAIFETNQETDAYAITSVLAFSRSHASWLTCMIHTFSASKDGRQTTMFMHFTWYICK